MSFVTISQKGWVVIPAALRDRYRWKAGDRVKVVDYGGVISLIPVLSDPEAEGMGSLRKSGRRRLISSLARSRRQERRRERASA
jgi:AbrB family looped-hinge helix DNA binding protein